MTDLLDDAARVRWLRAKGGSYERYVSTSNRWTRSCPRTGGVLYAVASGYVLTSDRQGTVELSADRGCEAARGLRPQSAIRDRFLSATAPPRSRPRPSAASRARTPPARRSHGPD